MPQIIVNSVELRRFARFLVEIANEIQGKKSLTSQKLDDLKTVWRDAKFQEFEPVYNKAAGGLDRFVKSALAYAQYLEEKARRVDRFLSR